VLTGLQMNPRACFGIQIIQFVLLVMVSHITVDSATKSSLAKVGIADG